MQQPELGKKIMELRKQRGLTQNELAETSNVDIRTIQRIEAGDVFPRPSTIRLIFNTLDYSEEVNVNLTSTEFTSPRAWITALIFLIAMLFSVGLEFALTNFGLYGWQKFLYETAVLVKMITGLMFFYIFFRLARKISNRLLAYSSVAVMLFILVADLLLLLNLCGITHQKEIWRIVISIGSIPGIAFAIGIFKMNKQRVPYAVTSAILFLVSQILFIFPQGILSIIGFLFFIPALILFVLMLWSIRQTKN